MIWLVLVIQVYFLLKDREWVSYKKMRYVLSQELVDAYSHRMHYSFHYCTIISFRISPVAKTFQNQYLHSAAACRSPRLSSNQCHCTFPHSRTGSCQWNHTSTWRSCICCFLKAARKEKHFVTASLSLQQTIMKSNLVKKIKSWLFTRLDEKHHKHKKKGEKSS